MRDESSRNSTATLGRSDRVRPLVVALSWVLLCACHRSEPAPIGADPTPSAKRAPPRSKPAVHDESFASDADPKTTLAWPRIELPDRAGAAITASVESEIRAEARAVDDDWRSTLDGGPRIEGEMPYEVEAECTAALVSYTVVDIVCHHSRYTGGAHESYWSTSEAWTIEQGVPRRFHAVDVFGAKGLDALAGTLTARLAAQGASFVVDKTIGAADLVTNGMLEAFVVDRDGLRFLFAPYAVATWAEGEPHVHLDWKELRALAPESTLLRTIDAAAHDPDAIVAAQDPDDADGADGGDAK